MSGIKIDELRFGFENCEQISIDGKYIGEFLIDDIHTSISRQAINSIDEMKIADTIVIEINRNANRNNYQFGQHDMKESIFDRITRFNDIVNISFNLVESNEEIVRVKNEYLIYPAWNEEEGYGYINNAQHSYISKCGNLYLVISKNKNIGDYFDMEQIDDEKTMRKHFSILDVGYNS